MKTKLGKAVKRNHVKRLIKESYRLNEKRKDGGYNIVFLVRKNCDICEVSYKDIEFDMKKILEEIGIN